jgi:predicted GNAT superfamily acetyltransferase
VNIECVVAPTPVTSELLREISSIADAIFDPSVEDLQWRLAAMPYVSVACARIEGELVGFKIGYAHSQSRYYSWLGGVAPRHRRQGIASKLMELQHSWAREQGFQFAETATDQANMAMTHANLKAGFFICGLKNKQGQMQVLFSKALRSDASA